MAIQQYLVSHAVAILSLLASLVMLVELLDSRRNAQSTFAWLLAIVFMPFVAIPLFLLLGRRKFPRHAKGPADAVTLGGAASGSVEPAVARVLSRSGAAPPRAGNAFELIASGEGAYTRLLALIASARRSIDLTVFILADDVVGRSVLDALAERAASGVRVRVILDAVGSARSVGRARRVLAAAGGAVRVFMPLRHSPIRGRTNLRSHRKLAITDGEHLFCGGMNVAEEYMGPREPSSGRARWRDLAAVVSGPAALDASALFESDWSYCGAAASASAGTDAEPAARGEELVQVVASGPDMLADTVYDAFLTGIFAARERLALVTPYYVPDEALQHGLVLAARRGVHIDVVVPARSNHAVADVARRHLLRELSGAGVRVHYYEPGMVHAKAMVIDQHCAYIGSPNFDMRSLFLNYEDAIFVYSPFAIDRVRAFIDGLISESVPTAPAGHENWLLERIARLLAPEL